MRPDQAEPEEIEGVVYETPDPTSGEREKDANQPSVLGRVIKAIRDSVRPPAPEVNDYPESVRSQYFSPEEKLLRDRLASAQMGLESFRQILENRKVYTAELLANGHIIENLSRDAKADPKVTASWVLRIEAKKDEIVAIQKELDAFLTRRSSNPSRI